MSIVGIFSIIFISFLSTVSIFIYYNSLGKKINNNYIVILSTITFMLLNTVTIYFLKIPLIYYIAIILLAFLYSFIFKIPIIKRIFIVLVINIVSLILEEMFYLFIATILDMAVIDIKNNLVYLIFALLLSKLSLIIIVSQLSKRKMEVLKGKLNIVLCLIPLFSLVIMYTLLSCAGVNINMKVKILIILSLLILVISNVFAFHLFDFISRKTYQEFELKYRSVLLENEKEYYQKILLNEYISNKTMHDLKNELFAIRTMLVAAPQSAYEKINEICEVVSQNKVIKVSDYDSINSLVTSKMNLAKNKGIQVEVNSFISKIDVIDQIDLCMILGNLFDNAIEACEAVVRAKKIELELKSVGGTLVIVMKNSTINKEVKKGITSKNDKINHGFGLSNIEEILKAYNGFMNYEIIDANFIIRIVIQGK